MIYAYGAEERVIVFNTSHTTPNLRRPGMWLAEPVKTPTILQLCHESHVEAIKNLVSLPEPYTGLLVNPKADIIQVKFFGLHNLEAPEPALSAEAFVMIEKFSLIADPTTHFIKGDLLRTLRTMMFGMQHVFPNMKSIHFRFMSAPFGTTNNTMRWLRQEWDRELSSHRRVLPPITFYWME